MKRSAAVPATERQYGIRTLVRYALPYRPSLITGIVFALAANAAVLSQPILIGRVLRRVLTREPIAMAVLELVGVFIGGTIVAALAAFVIGRTGEAVVRDLRIRMGSKLLRLPLAEHDRRRSGDLLSRASSDIMLLRSVLTTGPVVFVVGIVSVAGSIALMAYTNALLLGITLAAVVATFVLMGLILPRAKTAMLAAQQGVGRLIGVLDRSLRAIRTVKASRAEDREEQSVREQAQAAFQSGIEVAGVQAIVGPAMNLGVQGSMLLVLGIGGERVASGQLSIADLITFLLYLTTLAVPLANLMQFLNDLQKALAALQRVEEILALPSEPVGQGAAGVTVVTQPGALPVTFDSVTFGYDSAGDGRTILRELSFAIPAGSHTAIVGSSGAGKSTMLSLIERFYSATSGVVRIGDADVQSIPLPELRGLVSYVEQETPVLAGTIGENIRYAHPGASDEDVRRAVDRARLTDLLGRLPAGLDTSVGDAGVLMSGGERQRIAIARALVGNPQILLLDEATSQLDARNELAMRETIRAVAGSESTVVTVAHRLSTVIDADQILVIDQGQLVGSGRHLELLQTSPAYRELVQGQLLSTAPDDGPALGGGLADDEPEVVAAADEATARRFGWW